MAEGKKTPEASTEKKVETKKVFTFKCVTKCFWNGELFKVGDIVKMDSKDNVPKHFVLLNQ